jgi:hypothetical protein
VFDDELKAFLESGCATIVGLVTRNGDPFATRGWGSEIDAARATVRVLVGAGALAAAGRATGEEPFAIALTGGHIVTLRSVQAKGTAVRVEPPTDADLARSARFCDEFFEAVHVTDGTDRALLERLLPADLLAVTVEVDELYDQTPGPRAGAPLGGGRTC